MIVLRNVRTCFRTYFTIFPDSLNFNKSFINNICPLSMLEYIYSKVYDDLICELPPRRLRLFLTIFAFSESSGNRNDKIRMAFKVSWSNCKAEIIHKIQHNKLEIHENNVTK